MQTKTRRVNPATEKDFPGPSWGVRVDKRTLQSAAFRKWFDGSVVTNWDGSPRVMYHGTFSTITEQFISNRVGDEVAGWFAFDPDFAKRFSISQDYKTGEPVVGSTYPVLLSLKKIFDIRKEEDRSEVGGVRPADVGTRAWNDMTPEEREERSAIASYDWSDLEKWELVMAMKRAGFDGYLDFEVDSRSLPTGIAVFDPRNIKSLFNRGEWSKRGPFTNPHRSR